MTHLPEVSNPDRAASRGELQEVECMTGRLDIIIY
jgi:hypothetical protein